MLDALGVRADVEMQGLSLAPLLRGGKVPVRPMYAEASMSPTYEAALRTNETKYIRYANGTGHELYDLKADPKETKNLCRPDPAPCQRMVATRRSLARRDEDRRRASRTGQGQRRRHRSEDARAAAGFGIRGVTGKESGVRRQEAGGRRQEEKVRTVSPAPSALPLRARCDCYARAGNEHDLNIGQATRAAVLCAGFGGGDARRRLRLPGRLRRQRHRQHC